MSSLRHLLARGRLAEACAIVPVLVALAIAPATARAQEQCESGDAGGLPADFGQLRDFFPSDNATNVPVDGFIRLRYVGRAPARAVVRVRDASAGGAVVPGVVRVIGAEVHWQSDAPLAPGHSFEVAAPDLAAGAGDNGFTFTTGLGPGSSSPPVFTGVESASFVRNGESDLCGEPDAVEITVTWRPARDNGWPKSDVEYVIFETRGPGVGGPIERARERGRVTGSACGSNGETQCRAFRLAARNATGEVCFNVQAIDAYGRADGNAVEQCVNPSVGNFFEGCAVGRTAPARGAMPAFGLAALAAAAASLNRRRRDR